MRWPRIAVVIATYGKTDTLCLAIESALRQSYPDFHLLVIVDGNPPQATTLRELYGGDDRIAIHDLARNTGEQSGPNNVGAALTDAPLIAFLNHDDLWFPDHLAILAEAMLARHADLAFSQAAGVLPRGPTASAEDCRFYLVSRLPGGRYRPHYSFVGLTNVLVRKETLDALGGLRAARDCILESSQDFLIRALRAGARFAYADELTSFAVHSGIRPGSYHSGYDPQEQKALAAFLAGHDAAQVRAMVLRRMIPDDRWKLADLFVRATGFPLRLARPSLHRLRRGRMINHLRELRGLSPLPRPAVTVDDFVSRRRAGELPWIAREGPTEWSGDAIIPFLGDGWHGPEDWGCWAARRSATLRFGIKAQAGETIDLQIGCLLPRGRLQRLSARTAGGRGTRWFRLKPNDNVPAEITLRHRVAVCDEVVSVRLHALFVYDPSKHGLVLDRRRSPFAVGGLKVRFAQHLDVADNPQ